MKTPNIAAAGLSLFMAIGAAGATQIDDFVAGCLTSLNWDKAMCECAARKAQTELTPQGIAFQIASFRKDQAETARLRSGMDVREVVRTAAFMPHAGNACAQGK